MEQSVVSKLKQLAKELFDLQQICRAQIWQLMENKEHWRRCIERLDKDIRESRGRIIDLLNCQQIRKHIQSLGSHACSEFAKIHDLLPGYPLQILRWFSNEKHFNKWHLVEDEQAWASGWRELSQLSEWLYLIVEGSPRPLVSQTENADDIQNEAERLTRQAYRLFMRLSAARIPEKGKPGMSVSFQELMREEIVDSFDDETVKKAIKRLNKQLQVTNIFEAKIDGDRVRLARIAPDK